MFNNEKVVNKLKEINDVIETNVYIGDTREKSNFILKIVFIIGSILTFILTVINISTKSFSMALSTGVLFVLSIISYIAIDKFDKREWVLNVIGFSLTYMFTYYFIIGGNDGFAAFWIILIQYTLMSIGGIKYGIIISLYFLILNIGLCWTPCMNMLEYEYSVEFLRRFPFIYMLSFAFSVYFNYELQLYHIKQMSSIDNLNKAVSAERKRNIELAMQTIVSICNAVDEKDKYTKEHSARVAKYGKLIAKEFGWSNEQQEKVYIAGLIHDIGKIGIPDNILNKSGKLTDEEFDMIKEHTQKGYNILKGYDGHEGIVEVILYHHERYDGKGYPKHLKGKEIPKMARIITIADSFDAMNSKRVYRDRQSKEYIKQQLKEGKGKQFDPIFIEVFLKLLENEKVLQKNL